MKSSAAIVLLLVAAFCADRGQCQEKASNSLLFVTDIVARLPKAAKRPLQGEVASKGDLWHFYGVYPTLPKDEAVKTLKVEIQGDSVALVGVVEERFWRDDKGVRDDSKKKISCFLSAAKPGKTLQEETSVVKITPVRADGTALPTFEIHLRVSPNVKR
jgi:hypothetical protein